MRDAIPEAVLRDMREVHLAALEAIMGRGARVTASTMSTQPDGLRLSVAFAEGDAFVATLLSLGTALLPRMFKAAQLDLDPAEYCVLHPSMLATIVGAAPGLLHRDVDQLDGWSAFSLILCPEHRSLTFEDFSLYVPVRGATLFDVTQCHGGGALPPGLSPLRAT